MARVYTLREIIALLSGKVSEPAAEGSAGQHLDTDGEGGRYWSGTGQTVAAQQLRINGRDYTVRTGASGEAGYLTIGANALWIDTHQISLDLDGHSIIKMYGGTSIIYEKNASSAVLFDNGWVDNIPWGGNLLNRPSYTTLGKFDLSRVESNGYMRIYIGAGSSFAQVEHNAHVCTVNHVSIPANATKMKVRMMSPNNGSYVPVAIFGLLTDDCVNALNATNGGQLSSSITVSRGGYTDYEITLNNGIAGTDIYRAVVNIKASGLDDVAPNIYINKVWFE